MLHFERAGRYFEDARRVIERLREFIPAYDKAIAVFDPCLRDHTDTALSNARALQALREGGWEDFPNPSTGVYLLVERVWKDGSEPLPTGGSLAKR